jgi:hypothetical protein
MLVLMIDVLILIRSALASLFKARALLETEILVLRQLINVLRRKAPKRPCLTNLDLASTRAPNDEIPPPHHSITSSARARSVGGIVRPSTFAVLRLITSSSRDGNSTGKSSGRAPFRSLST